jgi:hypothetical protein
MFSINEHEAPTELDEVDNHTGYKHQAPDCGCKSACSLLAFAFF